MWKWLQSLTGGAPVFIGSLTGSFLGLVSLLLGALFNAHLNRRRDERIRKDDTRLVVTALREELASIKDGLLNNAERLEKEAAGDFYVPDIARSVRLMPELIGKIGLLNGTEISAVMKAFLLIDEYARKLLLMGGTVVPNLPPGQQLIGMPKVRTETVARLNRVTATEIEKALAELDRASLALRERKWFGC